jgi:hypothetical protein
MSRVCNLYQGSLCGDLSEDGDCAECGYSKANHEGEPLISCESSTCLFSSMGDRVRTDTPCRCLENAGFHGPLAMKAQQMLREVMILRAKVDALESPWIDPRVKLPAVPDGTPFIKVLIIFDDTRGYVDHPQAAYFDPSERERDQWQLADGSGHTYPVSYIAGWMYIPTNKAGIVPPAPIPSEAE